jgi:hypothetical protein
LEKGLARNKSEPAALTDDCGTRLSNFENRKWKLEKREENGPTEVNSRKLKVESEGA